MPQPRSLLVFFLAALVLVVPGLLRAERVALVVGINAYDHLGPRDQLTRPAANAEDMASLLTRLGYRVVGGATPGSAVTEVGHAAFAEATATFAREAKGAAAALFYFSGHGIQLEGEQFLLPRDTPGLNSSSSLKNRAISLKDSVVVALAGAGVPARVVVLDCSRDNPFVAELQSAMEGGDKAVQIKGVGEVSGYGPGCYLAFATSPGAFADDGSSRRNSLFTQAMLAEMGGIAAGQDIDFFFRRVEGRLGRNHIVWTNNNLQQRNRLFTLRADDRVGRRENNVPSIQRSHATRADRLRAATIGNPYVNSLGMQFVPVPGQKGTFMCRTETRVQDYRAYVQATGYTQGGGVMVFKDGKYLLEPSASWEDPGFHQRGNHPVGCVSWEEARAFCAWLTESEEGLVYRLPSDAEWSAAVGTEKYPWGSGWPAPAIAGNYFSKEMLGEYPAFPVASEIDDGFTRTAPVGSFAPNPFGFFDLGGNVWEWCEDKYRSSMNSAELLEEVPALRKETAEDGTPFRVRRGGSWINNSVMSLRSSYRVYNLPTARVFNFGFRVVAEASSDDEPGLPALLRNKQQVKD